MTSTSDLAWLPESQVLKVCDLSRSTLQSWKRAGLNLDVDAAYGLDDLVTLALLAETRDFLPPKEMKDAWRALSHDGADKKILTAARQLTKGDRFDLVIDTKYSSLEIARDDAELSAAVRHERSRPVVVLDVAETVFRAVKYFREHANTTARPKKKGPGRPRSAARLHAIGEGSSQ